LPPDHPLPPDKLYLKAITEKAWPLANCLTDHRNASKTAALWRVEGTGICSISERASNPSFENADNCDFSPISIGSWNSTITF